MIFIIIILIVGLVAVGIKALRYYYSFVGVLYYLMEKYNDELDYEKIRELTIMAIRKYEDTLGE